MYSLNDERLIVCLPGRKYSLPNRLTLSFSRVRLNKNQSNYYLPNRLSGVYMFCSNCCFGMKNQEPYPLYIGQSINMGPRLKQHAVSMFLRRYDKASFEIQERAIDFWYAKTDYLDLAESKLTQHFNPAFDGYGSSGHFWCWVKKPVIQKLMSQGFEGEPVGFDPAKPGRFFIPGEYRQSLFA